MAKVFYKILTLFSILSFGIWKSLANFVLMKKLLLALMVIFYGFSSSGATVQLHYCCGKLKNITWGSVQEKDCGMQQKMGSEPCCETKAVSAKDQDQDHEFYTVSFGSKAPVEPLVFYNRIQFNPVTKASAVEPIVHFSPPVKGSLIILNCVFRI